MYREIARFWLVARRRVAQRDPPAGRGWRGQPRTAAAAPGPAENSPSTEELGETKRGDCNRFLLLLFFFSGGSGSRERGASETVELLSSVRESLLSIQCACAVGRENKSSSRQSSAVSRKMNYESLAECVHGPKTIRSWNSIHRVSPRRSTTITIAG